jgi:hypothetical protein
VAHEDLVGGEGDGVKVDKVLDLAGKTEEGGIHDVGEVLCERHHVAAGLEGLHG